MRRAVLSSVTSTPFIALRACRKSASNSVRGRRVSAAPRWILASSAVAILGLASIYAPPMADASCNIRPAALRTFKSTTGSIETPISVPNKAVRLVVQPACDGSAGFEPVPADNDVTVTFTPPGGGASTPVVVDSGSITVANCTLSGGRCEQLLFPMPDTTAVLPPYGLAGPAEITVEDSGADVVAQIDQLFLPTTGCDFYPEQVFEKFSVMPPANKFSDLIDGDATELLATIDGGGNLMMPFDYWNDGVDPTLAQNPGSPVAIVLTGSIELFAFGNAGPTIADQLLLESDPSSFLRSFTLDGRPLPPLLRLTGTGEVLGTSDAAGSVIRIAVNDGEGGGDLYDLTDRFFSDRGPIIVDMFSFAKQSPLPLDGLRSSDLTVAFARDEAVEGVDLNADADQLDLVGAVIDVATGLPTSTGRTVARTHVTPLFLPPIGLVPGIEAGANEATFLELEADQGFDRNMDGDFDDNFLVVFDRDGTDLTPFPAIEVSPEPVVNDRTAVASDGKVFFRSPGLLVQSLVDEVGGLTSIDQVVGVTASADGKNVYVGSDGSDSLISVFARNPTTGALTFLETEDPLNAGESMVITPSGEHLLVVDGFFTLSSFSRDLFTGELTLADRIDTIGIDALNGCMEVVVSPDGEFVYVASSADNSLGIFSLDSGTGALTFIDSELDGVGGVNGLAFAERVEISPDGKHLYVLGRNDDGIAVFSRDAVTGLTTFVEFVDFLVSGPDLFEASDRSTQITISPDGRFLYATMYDASTPAAWAYERNSTTGVLTFSSEVQKSGDVDVVLSGFSDLVISPDGSRAYGTGSQRDNVIWMQRDNESGVLRIVSALMHETAGLNFLNDPDVLAISSDGAHLYIGTDTGDSVVVLATDQELKIYDTATQSLRPTTLEASEASVAFGRAVAIVSESRSGVDLNGDGDLSDQVAQLVDVTGPGDTIVDLDLAATETALSDQLIAVTVPEGSESGTPRNGDGDIVDQVLAVLAVGAMPPMSNVGVAAEGIRVTGNRVVFQTAEAADAIDRTGDGDTDDLVLRIYDASTDEVVDPGATVVTSYYEPVDPYVAFLVAETDEDPASPLCLPTSPALSCDLNGDGDDTDLVLFVYDIDARELIPTGQAALPCILVGCPKGQPFYVDPSRKVVIFITSEGSQGAQDLDGDGDAGDTVLQTFNIVNGVSYPVQKISDNATVAPPLESFSSRLPVFPQNIAGEESWFMRVRECELGFDLNEDGMITCDYVMVVAADSDADGIPDEFDTCVESPNADGTDWDGDGLGDSACDPTPGTPILCGDLPEPALSCRLNEAGKGQIQIKNSSNEKARQVKWKWNKGDATAVENFADPVGGAPAYQLCIYQDVSGTPEKIVELSAPPGGTCGTKPCWKTLGSDSAPKGYAYKNKDGSATGVTGIKFKAGDAGKAQVSLKAKGPSVLLPTLPLIGEVTVQLLIASGATMECFQTTYTTSLKNETTQYKAKGP